MIGSPGDVDTLGGDFTQDTNGNTGAREWVSHDEFVSDTEFTTKSPDFVFEEFAERLDEAHSLAVDHAFFTYWIRYIIMGLEEGRYNVRGRPPTLWWVLIVAEGPLNEILSMTSG